MTRIPEQDKAVCCAGNARDPITESDSHNGELDSFEIFEGATIQTIPASVVSEQEAYRSQLFEFPSQQTGMTEVPVPPLTEQPAEASGGLSEGNTLKLLSQQESIIQFLLQ